MPNDNRVDADELITFGTTVYRALGASEEEAHLIADSLVQADLWGHQSHGVMRLPWYAARLESGIMRAVTEPKTLVDAGAITLIDGQDGIGQTLAQLAVREAIQRAKKHGVGVVSMRNSNHFGTAMYHTRMAAQEGCIGFLTTNGSPAIAPWGGREKLFGNNPLSFAAPAGKHGFAILDIANTKVARGKIYLARQRGEPIPEGWALTPEGAPTTDAALGAEGVILPVGDHKGYGITYMMDVLSGVLSGSQFCDGVFGPYQAEKKGGTGHLMIALNIAAFRPLAEFDADMEEMVAKTKAVPLAQGFEDVYFPGELEQINDAKNRKDGIALPENTLGDLRKLADHMGLQKHLPF
jgi:LDH2 family malate/lactate/ureidoglycolate dehydrogenase